MAADRDFGTIERAINRRAFVFTPDCYINIIKDCRAVGGKFHVVKMTQDDFLDWEKLKNDCTIRSPQGIKFSDACYFKVTRSYNIGYELAENYLQLQLAGQGTKVRLVKGRGVTADKRFVLRHPKRNMMAQYFSTH